MDKKKPHNTPEDATQAIDESTQKEPRKCKKKLLRRALRKRQV